MPKILAESVQPDTWLGYRSGRVYYYVYKVEPNDGMETVLLHYLYMTETNKLKRGAASFDYRRTIVDELLCNVNFDLRGMVGVPEC